jgi:tripartite-type tricarboxylate transporter receptor subunit TctC
MLQNVRQGQLKPLAVAGDKRSDDLPGIPTVQESGIGNFDASTTYALFGPRGTSHEIVEWLHGQIGLALEDEAVEQKLRAAGVTHRGLGAPKRLAGCWNGAFPNGPK